MDYIGIPWFSLKRARFTQEQAILILGSWLHRLGAARGRA